MTLRLWIFKVKARVFKHQNPCLLRNFWGGDNPSGILMTSPSLKSLRQSSLPSLSRSPRRTRLWLRATNTRKATYSTRSKSIWSIVIRTCCQTRATTKQMPPRQAIGSRTRYILWTFIHHQHIIRLLQALALRIWKNSMSSTKTLVKGTGNSSIPSRRNPWQATSQHPTMANLPANTSEWSKRIPKGTHRRSHRTCKKQPPTREDGHTASSQLSSSIISSTATSRSSICCKAQRVESSKQRSLSPSSSISGRIFASADSYHSPLISTQRTRKSQTSRNIIVTSRAW